MRTGQIPSLSKEVIEKDHKEPGTAIGQVRALRAGRLPLVLVWNL